MFKFVKQIFQIISKKDKQKLVIIFFMILVSSFLDLFGVSTILPIVSLLSSPSTASAIENNALLQIITRLFNTTDTSTLAVISLVFLMILYTIKTCYSFLMTYVNVKFTTSFNRNLRARLMKVYLSMPYEYHHENNSSTLIRKSTYDVDIFCQAVSGFLSFSVKLTTALAIIIYLLFTSYIITLITGALLATFSLLTIYILKRRNRKIGKNIQTLNSYNYKYLSQSFNGIKESKISNNEDFFIEQYTTNINKINKLSVKKTMYSSVPSNSLEFIAILGIAISLLVIISIGGTERYQIISTFAVFAYALLKLLPCVSEITAYVNNFAFYSSCVNTISKDLDEVEKLEKMVELDSNYSTLPFNIEIMVNNVSFAYKDDPNKCILNNISLSINKNTSIAISGNSGAGKTTLVDLLLGLLKPTNGYIKCDGFDINDNVRGWRDNISYVPQNIFLIDDTIRNNVAFGIEPSKIDDIKIWEALEKAQLKSFVEESKNGLDTVIGERGIRLSGGQRQRIGIARAFYRNKNIIVLDEATSALDYETEKNILEHLTRTSKDHTLIIITHRLNTIESCDYIYQITNGNVSLKSNSNC